MKSISEIIKCTRNFKLLYVEDNDDAREMTSMILSDLFKSIESAIDGEDGLQKFKDGDFDLILTDINMPKLDGIEMIKEIKKIDKEVPILILSAHNESDFIQDSKDMGTNGYVFKPINLEQLSNVIYDALKDSKVL